MLKEGCMASYSDQPEMATEFRFTRVMAEQAARARLTLDDDQLSLIARTDALGQQLLSAAGTPQGLYVWGGPGGEKFYPRPLLPACRSPPGGGSIFITSSASYISG